MPPPGTTWYHIIINTHRSWLPGDERGFRSRNHRKHSRGDYKNPPPPGEHRGLHDRIYDPEKPAVCIPPDLYEAVARAVLAKAKSQGHRVLALSVDSHHVHLLVALPSDRRTVKQIVGSWKQRASHAIRDRLPGQVWSKSCDPIVIRDEAHHRRVFRYILAHAAQGAWVWSFRDGE